MKLFPLVALLGLVVLGLTIAENQSSEAKAHKLINADAAFQVAYAALLDPRPQPAPPQYRQPAALTTPPKQTDAGTPYRQASQAKAVKSLPNVHTKPTYSYTNKKSYYGRKCRRGSCGR